MGQVAGVIVTNRDYLTPTERRVMLHVSAGLYDWEIADKLEMSVHTVKAHMRNILHVLRARNRANAVAIFICMEEEI